MKYYNNTIYISREQAAEETQAWWQDNIKMDIKETECELRSNDSGHDSRANFFVLSNIIWGSTNTGNFTIFN
jgi:hypothetical protein